CVEQDDKGRDARKRAYCLKIQPATGAFARNLIYSTKPIIRWKYPERVSRIKKLITVATSGFQNSVHTQPVT
ncbi:hypothetical protein ACP6DV_28270, partial [Klebsiella pneumoniae subsp. pneumoniae]